MAASGVLLRRLFAVLLAVLPALVVGWTATPVFAAESDADAWFATVLGGTEAEFSRQLAENPGRAAWRNQQGLTALHVAAQRGRSALVRPLLAFGEPWFTRDEAGRTPLHAAALGGQTEIIVLLVDAGAPVDEADQEGWTPLHLAAAVGSVGAVKALLAAGADPQRASPQGGAIAIAADFGHFDVIDTLRFGAPLELQMGSVVGLAPTTDEQAGALLAEALVLIGDGDYAEALVLLRQSFALRQDERVADRMRMLERYLQLQRR